uniref:Indolethylamine N-methyltransferase n=1 Tax=Parasteatoda tepidariorum TaxID=114398 RepID=A0A2L2YJD4_PARTP
MEKEEKKIREHFLVNFDPIEFYDFKLGSLSKDGTEDNYDFWFSCLYEFFTTEKIDGERLLDLGSGPTVHNVATASSYFSRIVLSELVENCCEEIRKWLRKDPDCVDWSPMLERVAKIEKRKDLKAATKEIEERIRSSVKAVIHCDVVNDQVIAKEYAQEPYDVIMSGLTLETAAVDLDSHSKIIGRINRLLRKGGKLILFGPTKTTFWKVGDNTFHSFPIDVSDVQKSLEENGFGDIRFKLKEQPDNDARYNSDKLYFVTSTKL